MFHEQSYEKHRRGFSTDVADLVDRMHFAANCGPENANWWRDTRGYEIAEHLGGMPKENWLAIGDGRFGLDSVRLKQRGAADAFPANIDDSLLRVAREHGIISDYSVENAESMSFKNGSFDYVFCKEAYHHFPRPMIALYEMLRVARKGVILIEPNDRSWAPARRLVALMKTLARRGKHMDLHNYEEDGNYVFSISKREIEKVALGINMPQVAFKGFNDIYYPGIEFEPADISKSRMYRKMRIYIAVRDFLCRIRLDHPGMLMACLFHEPMSAEQRRRMINNGWKIVDLPRNPYVSA